jgi:hypothetical protein
MSVITKDGIDESIKVIRNSLDNAISKRNKKEVQRITNTLKTLNLIKRQVVSYEMIDIFNKNIQKEKDIEKVNNLYVKFYNILSNTIEQMKKTNEEIINGDNDLDLKQYYSDNYKKMMKKLKDKQKKIEQKVIQIENKTLTDFLKRTDDQSLNIESSIQEDQNLLELEQKQLKEEEDYVESVIDDIVNAEQDEEDINKIISTIPEPSKTSVYSLQKKTNFEKAISDTKFEYIKFKKYSPNLNVRLDKTIEHEMKETLKKLSNIYNPPTNMYVLGPIYTENKQGINECQIGITGKRITEDADSECSIVREIMEEVGVIVDENELKLIHTFKNKNKNFKGYVIHSSQCIPVPYILKDNKFTGNDIYTERVGCFIFGERDDIVKLVDNIKYQIESEEKDKIVGVAIIQITDDLKTYL